MQTDNNRVSLIYVSSVASLVVQFGLSLAAGRLNVNRRPRWKCISDAGRYSAADSLSSKVFSRSRRVSRRSGCSVAFSSRLFGSRFNGRLRRRGLCQAVLACAAQPEDNDRQSHLIIR